MVSLHTFTRNILTLYILPPNHLLINSFIVVSDYPASTIRSGNACNLLLYCTYYYSFFVYIINVIEFTSGSHLQIYNIKNGLSSPACFFHTSDDKSNGRIGIRSAFYRCIGNRQLIDIFLRENSILCLETLGKIRGGSESNLCRNLGNTCTALN